MTSQSIVRSLLESEDESPQEAYDRIKAQVLQAEETDAVSAGYASSSARQRHNYVNGMPEEEWNAARAARRELRVNHPVVQHGPFTIQGGKCYRNGDEDIRFNPGRLRYFAPNFRCNSRFVEIPRNWHRRSGWDGSETTRRAIDDLVQRCGKKAANGGWLVPILDWDRVMDEIVGILWDKARITDAEAMAILSAG